MPYIKNMTSFSSEKFEVRCILVDPSRDDYELFKRNIANHRELRGFIKLRVSWFRDIRLLYSWLRQQPTGKIEAVDAIFIDPTSLISAENFSRAVDFLGSVGISSDRIIALPDSTDADATWAALKKMLGDEQVFNKQDALGEGSWPQLINAIENYAARRSYGSGGQATQFFLMRLEAKVEALEENITLLRRGPLSGDLSERLDRLESVIEVIQNTIFQGPNTQSPALIQQVTDLTRMVASLDKDIGQSTDTLNTRIDRLEISILKLTDTLDKRVSELEDIITAAENSLKLRRAEFVYSTSQKVLLLVIGLVIAVVAGALGGSSLIELILKGLFG